MREECRWCKWPEGAWEGCKSYSGEGRNGFICSRHAGHDGPHVACGGPAGHALAMWDRDGRTTGGSVLVQVLRDAREALYNVPEVGEVYDEQHAGTHLRAVAKIEDALRVFGELDAKP